VPDRLKLQVWTPLPPQRSGVADHNMLLLPVLAELADVSVVVDDDDVVEAPEGVALVRRSEAQGGPADLAIYHMGNHHGIHRGIHDALVARPGLAVLHDPSLADFYGAYHEKTPGGFEAEIALNHGRLDAGPPRVRAGTEWQLDRLALQLARRVVEASLATVVHSPWARDVLTRQFPHEAIHHIDLAAPVADLGAGGPDMRSRAGWGHEHVVFGLLGGLWAHKRPELVVQIFAALHPLRPRARLLIAGRLEDEGALTRMRAAIAGAGVEDVVHVVTDVDDAAFTACVAACDVIVDLRWPSAGETSATVMRAFGAGRPAIVSDLPQYQALDATFCWRVPTDAPAAAGAALEVMLAVSRDPGRARRAGRLARRFVEESASLERVARRYDEVARQVVEQASRSARVTADRRPPSQPG
jgi:glycosyltransferase involved in cell wall biosynthesis